MSHGYTSGSIHNIKMELTQENKIKKNIVNVTWLHLRQQLQYQSGIDTGRK